MCGFAVHSKSIRPTGDVPALEPDEAVPVMVGADADEDQDSIDDDSEMFDDLDESDDFEDDEAPKVAFG